MKHATALVLALFGLAAMAPAQLRLDGILGRHVQVGISIGDHGGDRDRHEGRGREHNQHGERGEHRDYRRDSRPHGYWTTVEERVEIPGYWREETVPARYGWIVDHCGHRVWGVIAPACTHRVWVPPRCEVRTRRVWMPC